MNASILFEESSALRESSPGGFISVFLEGALDTLINYPLFNPPIPLIMVEATHQWNGSLSQPIGLVLPYVKCCAKARI